jgi:hypothetical protein
MYWYLRLLRKKKVDVYTVVWEKGGKTRHIKAVQMFSKRRRGGTLTKKPSNFEFSCLFSPQFVTSPFLI